MSDSLPARLRSYRFERELGRGGMGVVHLAYDEHLGRHVAIKKLRPDRSDATRRERLRREARTAARLTHPAIVQIFDLVEADDGDWIVMERVEGAALAELLRDGPLPVDRVLSIGRQIAEGLAAAHALGVLHRDLKTENVAVLADGRVKILDFGLAKELDTLDDERTELSHSGQILGTGRAMSPEQARGVALGPRSDLFSLGVLLYEIATGVSPFRGASFVDTLGRVAGHDPSSPRTLRPELSAELSELIERLLAKAPELRPASARAVADDLARLDEERRLSDRESTPPEPRDTRATWSLATDPATDSLPAASSSVDRAFRAFRAGTLGMRRGPLLAAGLALFAVFAVAVALWAPRSVHDAPRDLGRGSVTAARSEVDREINDPLALYESGMDAVRRPDRPENVEAARAIFERLLAADHDSAAAHAGLARVYWEKGRGAVAGGDRVFLEQAETVARDAVRLGPYLADAHVSLGLVLGQRGDVDGARQAFETALELEPTSADGHFGRGRLAQSEGALDRAEEDLRRAFTLRPEPLYGNALGALLYTTGRYDAAEEAFTASLEQAPDNVYALRNLGALAFARGRLDEASRLVQKALTLRPDASLYSNLGTILFSRGLYARAAAAFEDALAQPGAGNQWIFWLNLGDAYRQMPDRPEDARDAYARAVRLLDERLEASPGQPRLVSRRRLALARAGDLEAACVDGEIADAAGVYDLLALAVTAELCGARERALAHLETALRAGLELTEVRREPDLLALRADPRFHDLVVVLDVTVLDVTVLDDAP
ncbi:MAG: protein kinase [Acidobacteriota bacterium]